MRALKKGDLIPIVAEEEKVSEKAVSAAVACYWEELMQSVRGLKHLNVYIHCIGEVRVARSKLDVAEERVIRNIGLYPDSRSTVNAKLKLERIRELKKMRDQEYAKRDEVRTRRKIHDEAKKNLDK